jgi:hypothetical protein
MEIEMRIFWPVLTAFFLACPFAAQAETFPGRASGSIGDRAFDFALDCRGWQGEERMVFAADDDRNGADTNGDGVALSFDYFAPADTTNARLTLDGTSYNIGARFGRKDGDPVWEVDDNSARWLGDVQTLQGMVMADVTIDCAPREAAARGLTGRVSGTFGDLAIDKPLSCDSWGSEVVAIATEKASLPRLEAFYAPAMKGGSLVVTTEERKFELVAVGIMKTEFEITPDALRFAHEVRDKQTGEMIPVDLTFDCSSR